MTDLMAEYQEAFEINLRVYARRAGVEFRLTPDKLFEKLREGGFNMSSRKTTMYPVIRQGLLKKGVAVDQVHMAALIGSELLYALWYGQGFSNIHDKGYLVASQLDIEDQWSSIDDQVSNVVMDMNAVRNSERHSNSMSLPGMIKARLKNRV